MNNSGYAVEQTEDEANFIPNVPLMNIDIGQISGENEAKNPQFEYLFYTGNKKYEEICKKNKFIIKGRKGTGKTILAHYMKNKSKSNNICSCNINTLKDIELQKLMHLDERDFLPEEYKTFWRYCILKEIGNSILKNNNFVYKKLSRKLRKLDKFLKTRYDSPLKLMEVTKTYNTSKKKNKESKVDGKAMSKVLSGGGAYSQGLSKEKSSGISEKYTTKNYYNDVEKLEGLVLDCLKKEKEGYVIIYDDLDELGDNLDEHKRYVDLILGMIFAIQTLNDSLQKANENSKVIISIRSDILESLNKHSSNIRKIISDNSVDLYWLNKDCSDHTDYLLIDLILTKIKKSVDEYKDIDKKVLYSTLFPKDINNKQTADYLLDTSMGRPRQIIEFLNIIIKNYPDETTFKSIHFRSCLKHFSKELYSDLENEFSVYENKDELNDSMKLIKDLKKAKFEYGEVLGHYNSNKNKYKNIKTVEDSLNHMYSFGIIGMYRKKNKRNSRHSWGYRDDSEDSIDTSQVFLVHQALKHKFNVN